MSAPKFTAAGHPGGGFVSRAQKSDISDQNAGLRWIQHAYLVARI
jgi:hypothetical protein